MSEPPRVILAALPTPLQRAPRLSAELGVEIWLKRDDLTGLGLGGNKVRVLEYLLGDAVARGADVLVTGAGPQSNWMMLAAMAARRAGLDCELCLYGEPVPPSGNLLLVSTFTGAHVTFTGDPERASVDALIDEITARHRAAGRRPYPLPRGGATPRGSLGYLSATRELDEQLVAAGVRGPVALWLATGSCGTQGGLVAGARALATDRPVHHMVGVSVSRPAAECCERVLALACGAAQLAGTPTPQPGDVTVVDGWLGPGYGIASPAGDTAAALVAATEGVLLDPVFGAKAAAALIDAAGHGTLDGPVVLLVSGRRADTVRRCSVTRQPDPDLPPGYLGADARITSGPAPELVEAGYTLELGDAALLHDGLGLADLAHVLALSEAGLLPEAGARSLLATVLDLMDVAAADFPYDARYGDAYNSRERELVRRVGDTAGWVHLGRTRREAGRIAFRLALRDRLLGLAEAVEGFTQALVAGAGQTAGLVWADTTYLQPAQPSTFGHYLASFAEEAARHLDRIQAAHAWADVSPAGSGGVAGTRLGLDRDRLAGLLGFAVVGPNIRDTMWNVDGLIDCVLAGLHAALTADRLAEDLQIFATPGWGLVQVDASLCRASVLMPQKRNPYALSVIRAGTNTLAGRLAGAVATARTPSAATDNWLHSYGEVTGAVELATRVVRLAAAVVRTLTVEPKRLAATAAGVETGATDLADELTLRLGWDYRTAYRVVGRAVAGALAEGRPEEMSVLDLDEAAQVVTGQGMGPAGLDEAWLRRVLDPVAVVAGRRESGGCGPDQLAVELDALDARVGHARAWRTAHADAAVRTRQALVAHARAVAG